MQTRSAGGVGFAPLGNAISQLEVYGVHRSDVHTRLLGALYSGDILRKKLQYFLKTNFVQFPSVFEALP